MLWPGHRGLWHPHPSGLPEILTVVHANALPIDPRVMLIFACFRLFSLVHVFFCGVGEHPSVEHPLPKPGSAVSVEASDGASIHRCQPGNVRFLDASDGASIRPCQPGNVRFLRCQPGHVRFLEASDGVSTHRSSIPCQNLVVQFL